MRLYLRTSVRRSRKIKDERRKMKDQNIRVRITYWAYLKLSMLKLWSFVF